MESEKIQATIFVFYVFRTSWLHGMNLFLSSTEDDHIRDIRISSVALRIFGSLVALNTAAYLIAGLTLVAGSSLAVLALLVSSMIGAVLAHDLIQMGYNQSNAIRVATPHSKNANIVEIAGHYANGIYQLGKIAVQEATRETPYILHDTWLFEPVYEFLKDTETQKHRNHKKDPTASIEP